MRPNSIDDGATTPNRRGGGPPKRCPVDRGRTKAQTTLDFAVGAGVFLLTVTAVVAFVPGMFDPFTGEQEATIVADRLASQLAEDALAEFESPYVLNATCTGEFFERFGDPSGPPASASCRFDGDATALNDALGVSSRYRLNVTVEDASGIVSAGGVSLEAGDPAPGGSARVTVGQRAVLYDEGVVRLYVRVW
ncbi:DUF7287 family protein [Halegenticoccus soli]|uniref:DUF7287 family protein n=1 Tax=Halegenticoccus soli TaxID=1985678 RepID=UPI000C6CA64A|nr:hypothetical protein [Halegenticoccus soli]